MTNTALQSLFNSQRLNIYCSVFMASQAGWKQLERAGTKTLQKSNGFTQCQMCGMSQCHK